MRLRETKEDDIAEFIRLSLDQLLHAPLPPEHLLPIISGVCHPHILPYVVQRERRRAGLLVLLPPRFLALSSAVPCLFADGAALERPTLRAAVGAAGLKGQILDRRGQGCRHVLACDLYDQKQYACPLGP